MWSCVRWKIVKLFHMLFSGGRRSRMLCRMWNPLMHYASKSRYHEPESNWRPSACRSDAVSVPSCVNYVSKHSVLWESLFKRNGNWPDFNHWVRFTSYLRMGANSTAEHDPKDVLINFQLFYCGSVRFQLVASTFGCIVRKRASHSTFHMGWKIGKMTREFEHLGNLSLSV